MKRLCKLSLLIFKKEIFALLLLLPCDIVIESSVLANSEDLGKRLWQELEKSKHKVLEADLNELAKQTEESIKKDQNKEKVDQISTQMSSTLREDSPKQRPTSSFRSRSR